jgi:hypothetical protein
MKVRKGKGGWRKRWLTAEPEGPGTLDSDDQNDYEVARPDVLSGSRKRYEELHW